MSIIQAQGMQNSEVSMNADIGDRMTWPPLTNQKLPWTIKEEAATKKQLLEQAEVIKVVKALSYLLKHLDPDGIEVVCTSSPGIIKRLKTATDIKNFINKEFRSGYDANCAIEVALDVVLETVRAKYLEQPRGSRLSRVPTFSTSRSPTRRLNIAFIGAQYAGIVLSSVTMLLGPTMSTPQANTSGVNDRPTSVAYPP